jgi:soluble lytic murein transglycosylase-like protein
MSNWMIVTSHSLWRIGLVGMALWAVPPYLWNQEVSYFQQAHSSASQPFARFDDSLTRVADTLLDSASQTTPPAAVNTNVDITSTTGIATRNDQRFWPWGNGHMSLAAARLNLLFPAVEPILRNHGIPADLAAVILVESSGRVDALSPKGARGLWQLMPDTARRYGLRVDEIHDDRLDLFRATDAAARYLHDLYGQFGDWKLALAAYNTGEANVGSAILRAHTQDFDQLTNLRILPLETRIYVPRVLAMAQLFGQSSTLVERRSPASATVVFAVSGP